MARQTAHFEIIPRGRRLRPHLATIRRASIQFRKSLASEDVDGQGRASTRAWDALAAMFEILRGEQDDGHLDASYMDVSTGLLVNDITGAEQHGMIKNRAIDRRHAACSSLSLREALSKIAHYRSSEATFRVDGRGAHYLVLGGRHRRQRWVAEILVSRLHTNAAAAAAAIRWHP